MRGYVVRCGTSGLIHSSDWVPGLSLVQMLLPRERGKLTVVPRVSGIFRTSEWKGCAICEKQLIDFTCVSRHRLWVRPYVDTGHGLGGVLLEVQAWPGRSAATFLSD